MNRIILVYQPGTPNEIKYCIQCNNVPPPLPPGGPGTLEIHPVERREHHNPPDPDYKYLAFQRLAACDTPDDTDIIIKIEEQPENTGRIIMPFNGGYVPGGPPNIISIKLLEPNQLNP